MRVVGSGKVRDAFDWHVGVNFRHHNACFRGDRESLMRAMEPADGSLHGNRESPGA